MDRRKMEVGTAVAIIDQSKQRIETTTRTKPYQIEGDARYWVELNGMLGRFHVEDIELIPTLTISTVTDLQAAFKDGRLSSKAYLVWDYDAKSLFISAEDKQAVALTGEFDLTQADGFDHFLEAIFSALKIPIHIT